MNVCELRIVACFGANDRYDQTLDQSIAKKNDGVRIFNMTSVDGEALVVVLNSGAAGPDLY